MIRQFLMYFLSVSSIYHPLRRNGKRKNKGAVIDKSKQSHVDATKLMQKKSNALSKLITIDSYNITY